MNKDKFKPLIKAEKEIKDLKKTKISVSKPNTDDKYKKQIEELQKENQLLKSTIDELKNKQSLFNQNNEQILKDYYKHGFEDCRKKYLLDLDKCLSNIEYILSEKDNLYKEKSEEVKNMILSIVREVIEKLLGKYKEEQSLNLVLNSLDEILKAQLIKEQGSKNIIYMNGNDLKEFENLLKQDNEIKNIVEKYNLKFYPSKKLNKGDLVINTEDIYISAKIKDKLEKIMEYLKENVL